MKYYYHATDFNNLTSISINGIEARGCEKLVYLCETPEDALKFVVLRGYKNILLCKIKMLKADEKNIVETFDHSYNFFKCRAFGYKGNINSNKIVGYRKYTL